MIREERKERIGLNDNQLTATLKLAEGNPGALNALICLAKDDVENDPDSIWRDFTSLITLDSLGLYGSNIYVLFNDLCGGNTFRCAIVLRASQLGLIRQGDVHLACRDERADAFDFPKLLAAIRDRIPNFGSGQTLECTP